MRPPEEISLRDVVALLDDDAGTRCPLTPSGQCPLQPKCDNYDGLCGLQEEWMDWLAEISIADLAGKMAAAVP